MENPATWKRAELVIGTAMSTWHAAREVEPDLCGASIAHHVADELRRAGLLNDADEPEVGHGKVRDYHATTTGGKK